MDDEERCPYCNMPLNNLNRVGRMKHKSRCKPRQPARIYSDRSAGRPKEHKRIESPPKVSNLRISLNFFKHGPSDDSVPDEGRRK